MGVKVLLEYQGDFYRWRVTKSPWVPGPCSRACRGCGSSSSCFDEKNERATDFYVWNEGCRRAFFSDERRERVTGLYGVAPGIEFVEIAPIVDDANT
jgi:hypothetical protein